MIADLPNPLAKARDEFMLSREACYLCDPTSIGAPAHCGLYLHDRIEAAFLAGWNACEAAQPVQPSLTTNSAQISSGLVAEREEFMLSPEGTRLCDALGIGAPARCGLYLRDRIEAAFVAGWNACEQEMAAAVSALRDVGVTDFDKLVNRFLGWSLPTSVCVDLCVTMSDYPHPRSGTNLLSAHEARAMLEYVLYLRSFKAAPSGDEGDNT